MCFHRSLNREQLQPVLLYCRTQSEDLNSQGNVVLNQTDMVHYVSLQNQHGMEVPVFTELQKTIVQNLVTPQIRKALFTRESNTLATLHHTLLPQLNSSKYQVKDADRILAEATS